MIRLTVLAFTFLLLINSVYAQCATEPTIETAGRVLIEKKFKTPFKTDFFSRNIYLLAGVYGKLQQNEIVLSFDASGGTNWETKAAEAAVVTVFVNGKYNQDVMLFGGAEKLNYRVLLGNFPEGQHKVTLVWNEKRSAPNAKNVIITALNVLPASVNIVNEKDFEKNLLAVIHTPVVYARPNAVDKFTDIPLVSYYEIIPEPENVYRIRYTTIFSHEDGGTQAVALMARWGRVTDIEWVYEIKVKEGKIVEEIYQGANHETKNFTGKKVFGSHPLLFNVTVNNNFADAGCSALRFAPLPVKADLSAASRETLMEQFPWTYRVMSEEVIREGRVDAEKIEANIIADPRDYLYVEVQTELQNAAVSVETNGGATTSDFGNKLLRVNRSGFVRIALRLPKDFKQTYPDKIAVRCHTADESKGDGVCKTLNVIKVVRLNKGFKPLEKQLKQMSKTNVKVGEAAEFAVD